MIRSNSGLLAIRSYIIIEVNTRCNAFKVDIIGSIPSLTSLDRKLNGLTEMSPIQPIRYLSRIERIRYVRHLIQECGGRKTFLH